MNEVKKEMFHQGINLREAESAEIISLMDNSADYLSTIQREEVKNVREWTGKHFILPMAEHGFSMLVRVLSGGKSHSILFDAGSSLNGVLVNAKRMGLNLAEIECIVLSHGHYDHFGGLSSIVKAVNKDKLPIIAHEDMFKTRGVANPDGTVREYLKFPTEEKVKPARYINAKQPYMVADNLILVTGEIPRETSFEKGYPQHRVFIGGEWRPDPLIMDDRALVINIKEKGLVILSGCAHAGIINTILYAQHLTGVKTIYGILGGLHLAGKQHEQRINQTVKVLKRINPKLIAPSHCTGWRGKCKIARVMPEAFVWNSVGNIYTL
jgi:7,8-dihydropterin-6-yl-methyl-4-(beta-D-ribofuranosyl)aminobenzene 5'-phosphate synthase